MVVVPVGTRCGKENIEQKATRVNHLIADEPPHRRHSLLGRMVGWLIVPLYVTGV